MPITWKELTDDDWKLIANIILENKNKTARYEAYARSSLGAKFPMSKNIFIEGYEKPLRNYIAALDSQPIDYSLLKYAFQVNLPAYSSLNEYEEAIAAIKSGKSPKQAKPNNAESSSYHITRTQKKFILTIGPIVMLALWLSPVLDKNEYQYLECTETELDTTREDPATRSTTFVRIGKDRETNAVDIDSLAAFQFPISMMSESLKHAYYTYPSRGSLWLSEVNSFPWNKSQKRVTDDKFTLSLTSGYREHKNFILNRFNMEFVIKHFDLIEQTPREKAEDEVLRRAGLRVKTPTLEYVAASGICETVTISKYEETKESVNNRYESLKKFHRLKEETEAELRARAEEQRKAKLKGEQKI